MQSSMEVIDTPDTQVTNFPIPNTTEIEEAADNRQSGTIAAVRGEARSETPVLTNKDTKEIAAGFYQLSGNAQSYEVSYDQPSGIFTITLYGENTKQSRVEAEAYLLKSLPYTKLDWCNFVVTVLTNEYENPRLAGQNLGLSFCPGAAQL